MYGLNCSQQTSNSTNIISVDAIFTTREKINACCASILKRFLGHSHNDEIMRRVYRLIFDVKLGDRVCLSRTVHFIITQVLELRINYYNEYRKYLTFVNGDRDTANTPMMTL
jgi:hypothetical protein